MKTAERVARQFDIDTLQIALGRKGYGYKRVMELCAVWKEVRAEYWQAIQSGPEQDVAQDRLQRELLQIAKDPKLMVPFEERYPEVKQPTYGRRR